jgi:hypothetical protein
LHHHRIVGDRIGNGDDLDLVAIHGLALEQHLENGFRDRPGGNLAVLHGACNPIMRAEVDRAIILAGLEAVLQQQGPRNEVARRGRLIAIAEILAADIRERRHRTPDLRQHDRVVGRRAALDPDCERLDLGRSRFGQNVGERTEIRDLDAAEPHRLDHRRIVGGHDELDVLLQLPLEIGLERLRVLDDRRRVLIGQQRDAKLGRVAVLRERGSGRQEQQRGCAPQKHAAVHA